MSRRAERDVAFHYDVSNEFYALFLDPRMVYTCAYYRRPDAGLATAQEDKLELVCRKLQLAPGERLLDLGCGWGALALWAAERWGVEVHGVTLSAAQATWAAEAARRAGLAGRVRIERADWRDVAPEKPYDKIAAIGLIEHVGRARHPAYFAQVHRLLTPGGLFLNHGITCRAGARRTSEMAFLQRHVFPGGELAPLDAIVGGIERAGFEIVDVEDLRPHYARTTRQWVERLQANAERARALVGERVYRTYLAYLAGASVAFDEGWIALHQVVATRRGAVRTPATREAVYALPWRTTVDRAS
ncbi:MAG TPA: cyclopropane-fatty-acyl-phospholipid synthase family protein [Candidatus Limnocylindria bacterium]|nr:cyclopropane-fatty-acyl-phospholipid synthase family protein [Candidatus Limnocylindria bacterium]